MFDNPRAGSLPVAISFLLFTLGTSIVKYLGYANALPWWVVIAPGAYVVAKLIAYDLIRNAVREGVTQAAIDTGGEVRQSPQAILNSGIFDAQFDGEMQG